MIIIRKLNFFVWDLLCIKQVVRQKKASTGEEDQIAEIEYLGKSHFKLQVLSLKGFFINVSHKFVAIGVDQSFRRFFCTR